MKLVITIIAVCLGLVSPALGKITVLKCSFATIKDLYYTMYSDGAPTRVGTGIGIGNKSVVVRDNMSDALVIIENNTTGIPITITTVSPDLTAVHSRHLIDLGGKLSAPSQGKGTCKYVPVR
jgi:hypothetical protein